MSLHLRPHTGCSSPDSESVQSLLEDAAFRLQSTMAVMPKPAVAALGVRSCSSSSQRSALSPTGEWLSSVVLTTPPFPSTGQPPSPYTGLGSAFAFAFGGCGHFSAVCPFCPQLVHFAPFPPFSPPFPFSSFPLPLPLSSFPLPFPFLPFG